MVYADFRNCKESKMVREKVIEKLYKNWEGMYNQTLPPFDDKLSKSFSQKYMKKHGTGEPVVSRPNKTTKKGNTRSHANDTRSHRDVSQSGYGDRSAHQSNKPSDSNFKSGDSVLKTKLEAMMAKDTKDFTDEEKALMEQIRNKQFN